MNKTKMIKTVKKKSIYDVSSIDPSGQSYLKAANQSSGRIRRRTILGEKFDYGEKIKEKQNYVLYVAGQGQEKKEIEEIEELPNGEKKERIVEQKQIIDNYQYHETKEIKKKHSRGSQTQHKRLCDPFERTMVKKYSSSTSEPRKGGYKIIRTTNIVDKNDYSRDFLHNSKNNIINLTSLTSRTNRSQNSRRIESNSNMSNSSSTNESYKGTTRTTNITQINNRNKRPMSNGGRIIDFSKYERKKVNGSEKVSNSNINQVKNKTNLIPQKSVKYNYDKDKDVVPTQQNYNCNRIPINVSKYVNSNNNKIQTNQRIKIDYKSRQEKALIEGPKYQLIGKDLPKDKPRPKTVSHSRNRSNRVRKQQQKKQVIPIEKKGYIPFGGKGYRVGGAPVQIPRPNNNNIRSNNNSIQNNSNNNGNILNQYGNNNNLKDNQNWKMNFNNQTNQSNNLNNLNNNYGKDFSNQPFGNNNYNQSNVDLNNPFKRTNSNNLRKDSDNMNQIQNEYEAMNTNFFPNNDSNNNKNKTETNNNEYNKDSDFNMYKETSNNFGNNNLSNFMQQNYFNYNNDKTEKKTNNTNYQTQSPNSSNLSKNNGMIGNFNININNYNSFNMNFNNIKKDNNDELENNNLMPNQIDQLDDNTNALLEQMPNPSEIFNKKNE